MITLAVAGALLVLIGGGTTVQAGQGCCGNQGVGLLRHYQPAVIWYEPYPYWWPQYFGPPYTDYQVVQYVTPPAVSAEIVKERIAAINAANPALLPLAKEPLPLPKPDGLPPVEKLPSTDK